MQWDANPQNEKAHRLRPRSLVIVQLRSLRSVREWRVCPYDCPPRATRPSNDAREPSVLDRRNGYDSHRRHTSFCRPRRRVDCEPLRFDTPSWGR
jgi:hypothetical protein